MADKLFPIEGSAPPVDKHKLVAAADPNECLEVTLKLRRHTEEGLPTVEQFVAGQRPAAMTRQEFTERHGARPEDAESVQRWAVGEGLAVSHFDATRRQLKLVGSVDDLGRAFGAQLAQYEHARTGEPFRCHKGHIHVPESLAQIVSGVFGLDNMPIVKSHAVPAAIGPAPEGLTPADAAIEERFAGSFFPNEVAELYNFPPTKGAGQRVAILEFGGGFSQSVLADYFRQHIGLTKPPTVNAWSVQSTPMQINSGATGEVYLDIEVVGAMAPEATIDVFFAPWTGQGYLSAIDAAIHQEHDYAGVSISWGMNEDVAGWTMLHKNIDDSLRDAAAIGIPVFISAGDQGSGDQRGTYQGSEVTLLSRNAHTNYPAASPLAIACGGTMLYAENGKISKEIVWNELAGPLQAAGVQGAFYLGGATGGGVSDRYTQVPNYQSDAGIEPKSVNPGGATGRGVPDVAGNAGASTGYLVSQPPGSTIAIAPVGGTSATAPMWAALMACVRAALSEKFNGKIPTFFLNDFVYENAKTAAFRDIVGGRQYSYDKETRRAVGGEFIPTGNNCSSQAKGYDASQGYNLCTGCGSPNGQELLNQLETWIAAHQKT